MRDPEIREALHRKILARHHKNPNTLVIDELGLWHGASRVDIAVVNGLIHGYEIKSDRDTLNRLPSQAEIYSEVLDRATIVCGEKHQGKIEKFVPPWWGFIVTTEKKKGSIGFRLVRQAKQNPAINPMSLATLLWRDEALALLASIKADKGYRNKSKKDIYQRLVETMPLEKFKKSVRQAIKARQVWRAGQPQM